MNIDVGDLFNWIAGTIGIVGVFLSIYFYTRSKRFKQPAFYFGETVLQKKNHPNVEITFEGYPVINLSQLRAVYWNKGNQAIRKEDIPEKATPHLIFPEDSKILSVAVLTQSPGRETASFQTNHVRLGNVVTLNFDYLNPGDGAIIEILYDSEAGKSFRRYPRVAGTLLDVKNTEVIDIADTTIDIPFRNAIANLLLMGLTVYPLLMLAGYGFYFFDIPYTKSIDRILTLFFVLLGVMMLRALWRRTTHKLTPKWARDYIRKRAIQ